MFLDLPPSSPVLRFLFLSELFSLVVQFPAEIISLSAQIAEDPGSFRSGRRAKFE